MFHPIVLMIQLCLTSDINRMENTASHLMAVSVRLKEYLLFKANCRRHLQP